ncbi:MAG: STAS domain-containing protein [Desulfatibacillum sp.]|nr:STAS domain-containing protein [Desulfatibacillum sp.]
MEENQVPAPRNFTVSQDMDGAYVLKGELTIHDLDYLREFLESSAVRSGRVVLSFAELAFADTASLQFLASFKRGMGISGGLVIGGLSSEMEKILRISGLASHLL